MQLPILTIQCQKCVFAVAPIALRNTERIDASKSNGAQHGTPSLANCAKASKFEISPPAPKRVKKQNVVPVTPPEAFVATCFMSWEEMLYLSDFIY